MTEDRVGVHDFVHLVMRHPHFCTSKEALGLLPSIGFVLHAPDDLTRFRDGLQPRPHLSAPIPLGQVLLAVALWGRHHSGFFIHLLHVLRHLLPLTHELFLVKAHENVLLLSGSFRPCNQRILDRDEALPLQIEHVQKELIVLLEVGQRAVGDVESAVGPFEGVRRIHRHSLARLCYKRGHCAHFHKFLAHVLPDARLARNQLRQVQSHCFLDGIHGSERLVSVLLTDFLDGWCILRVGLWREETLVLCDVGPKLCRGNAEHLQRHLLQGVSKAKLLVKLVLPRGRHDLGLTCGGMASVRAGRLVREHREKPIGGVLDVELGFRLIEDPHVDPFRNVLRSGRFRLPPLQLLELLPDTLPVLLIQIADCPDVLTVHHVGEKAFELRRNDNRLQMLCMKHLEDLPYRRQHLGLLFRLLGLLLRLLGLILLRVQGDGLGLPICLVQGEGLLEDPLRLAVLLVLCPRPDAPTLAILLGDERIVLAHVRLDPALGEMLDLLRQLRFPQR
mmetsp:Transcript_11118/g.39322  ORF Transcript_11118/g.39322 Transcript_11118/m.39322 type:complete len:504 (-) Transcript_11118:820-2331(-)